MHSKSSLCFVFLFMCLFTLYFVFLFLCFLTVKHSVETFLSWNLLVRQQTFPHFRQSSESARAVTVHSNARQPKFRLLDICGICQRAGSLLPTSLLPTPRLTSSSDFLTRYTPRCMSTPKRGGVCVCVLPIARGSMCMRICCAADSRGEHVYT